MELMGNNVIFIKVKRSHHIFIFWRAEDKHIIICSWPNMLNSIDHNRTIDPVFIQLCPIVQYTRTYTIYEILRTLAPPG